MSGGHILLLIPPQSLLILLLPVRPHRPPKVPLKSLCQPYELPRERVDPRHLPDREPAQGVAERHEGVVDGAEPGLRVAVGEDELCVGVGGDELLGEEGADVENGLFVC